MLIDPLAARFLLVLGLGFFFGLAFEEFYGRQRMVRPGGVRTFPLLGLCGAVLYRLDPVRAVPLTGGLVVLGLWLAIYYWRRDGDHDGDGLPNVGLMVPACNLLAFLLGPLALAEPPWAGVGVTVTAVLLLTARQTLHDFARRLELDEILTAGKFLILTGLIMPLLPAQPVTSLTDITPHQVWLAVIAVCTVSYASYLLQTYVIPGRTGLWVAVLGGLYSSTATTVVLARQARLAAGRRQALAGVIAATAVMYLRLLAIIAVFNWTLALALGPTLLGLSLTGGLAAGLWYRAVPEPAAQAEPGRPAANPLELTPAFVFAGLFVLISLLSSWARSRFGVGGIYALAALVGVSDIDPFVLNIAENGAPALPTGTAARAILIAVSSNNLLKAGYTIAFAGARASLVPVAVLALLAAAGVAVASGLLPTG